MRAGQTASKGVLVATAAGDTAAQPHSLLVKRWKVFTDTCFLLLFTETKATCVPARNWQLAPLWLGPLESL